MTDNNQLGKARGGAVGFIRSGRLLTGGVRIEMGSSLESWAIELAPIAARRHAEGVLRQLQPLTDQGAAALAIEQDNVTVGRGPGEDPPLPEEPLAWDYPNKPDRS